MKKLVLIVLTAVMVFGLAACSGNVAENTSTNAGDNSVPQSKHSVEDNAIQSNVTLPETEQNSSRIEFNNVILLDNEWATVTLVSFYEYEVNWVSGTQVEKCIEVSVHNNSSQEYIFNLYDAYVGDETMLAVMHDGNAGPAPGRSGTFRYYIDHDTTPDSTALASLEELYELEGVFEIYASDGSHKYDFSIADVLNPEQSISNRDSAVEEQGFGEFQNVADLLNGGTWYFNGGSNTALNSISFSGSNATISQVFFDGNGRHENGSNSFAYMIDATSIHVPTAGGGQIDIAYELTESGLILDQTQYLSLEQVDAGLQGYWTYQGSDAFGSREYNVYINSGTITAENANTAGNGPAGAYYYYGPDTGSYTLDFGGFNTQMRHGGEYFFNIINGSPVLLRYDHVFSPGNGLPGENGYSFN